MIRKTLFALTLAFAGSTAAFAAEAPEATSQNVTTLTVAGDYPSEPGPYTVIYREWSDLAG
ncbi:hypothetical protein [Roseiterribacter gracilis]|uniref:Uncharacterized protein n=1 Tax=Roseiterribacter gracilis TaxID=2812848 RepID=A0A8S8XC14_9PROT|nr:hypothetical protein TMPK1_18590 [Rhodospirillales bacterium TMPK1]